MMEDIPIVSSVAANEDNNHVNHTVTPSNDTNITMATTDYHHHRHHDDNDNEHSNSHDKSSSWNSARGHENRLRQHDSSTVFMMTTTPIRLDHQEKEEGGGHHNDSYYSSSLFEENSSTDLPSQIQQKEQQQQHIQHMDDRLSSSQRQQPSQRQSSQQHHHQQEQQHHHQQQQPLQHLKHIVHKQKPLITSGMLYSEDYHYHNSYRRLDVSNTVMLSSSRTPPQQPHNEVMTKTSTMNQDNIIPPSSMMSQYHHQYHHHDSSTTSSSMPPTTTSLLSTKSTTTTIPCQSYQRYNCYPFSTIYAFIAKHTYCITKYVYCIIPSQYLSLLPIMIPIVGLATLVALLRYVPSAAIPQVKVAMIGNSMMYYNDLPRFLEAISEGHIKQDSCLHGNANFNTILTWGNGMYNIWDNGDSRIYNYHHGRIHDYGACTVEQLLFGKDDTLNTRVNELYLQDFNEIVVSSSNDDDLYNTTDNTVTITDDNDDTDDRLFQKVNEIEKVYSDDFVTYYDGSNPCLRNPYYYYYLENKYQYNGDKWDYIILNDNTRTPARNSSRYDSLSILNTTYLPWIEKTGAIPIFLATYGYWTPYRDMGGLGTIAQFTSLTYEGYDQYKMLLQQYLPSHQTPRIAPVGIAFLLIYEENYSMWQRLFHVDQIHCSPLGTYLQGIILYHTIYHRLPNYDFVVRPDMSTLFLYTRRFQPGDHRRDPYPTISEAAYLYHIAKRVVIHQQYPKSFIRYNNGEAVVDYDPQDDIYKQDDLF